MSNLNEEISNLEQQIHKIQTAVGDSASRDSRIKYQIREIENAIPVAVFKSALGEVSDDEPAKLRRELADLRLVANNHKHIRAQTNKALSSLEVRLRALHEKRKARTEYETWKENVTNNPGLILNAISRNMWKVCELACGNRSDYDKFITSMQGGNEAA